MAGGISDSGLAPPLREPFVAARSNIEQVGLAGVPLTVERERAAQLGITVGDYSFAAAGPLHVYEQLQLSQAAVAVRFGISAVWSRDGFHLRSMINRSAAQVGISVVADPSLIPALAGTVVAAPVSLSGIASTISNISGDAAAGLGLGWNLLGSQAWQWERGVWIPPNRTLLFNTNVVNTAHFVLLELSQPRA